LGIVPVLVPPDSGALEVLIASPSYPQDLGGVLWRYRPDKSADGRAGSFTPRVPKFSIGSLVTCKGFYFRLEGYVVHHNDSPPTPYQVVVTIAADGRPVHSEVPEQGGTGVVGDQSVAFLYVFQIQPAT